MDTYPPDQNHPISFVFHNACSLEARAEARSWFTSGDKGRNLRAKLQTRPRQASSLKCPSCSPGWPSQGHRYHHQRVRSLAAALLQHSRRFSMYPLLSPQEDHEHRRRSKSSQLPQRSPLHVCSRVYSVAGLPSDRPADASTTRLARAEDVRKPPKTTGSGRSSSPLAIYRPSDPWTNRIFLEGCFRKSQFAKDLESSE